MSTRPCIILAGGLGTRLRDAVPDKPKCLAPIGKHPFLELQIRALAAQGFDRFILSLGHMAGAVQDAARSFSVEAPLECVVEPRPLGTGGAVFYALLHADLVEAAVINGDTMVDADLSAMHTPLDRLAGESMRMAIVEVDDRARYGGVEFQDGRVIGFIEKGRRGPGAINAGLYRVHLDAFGPLAGIDAFSMETAVMPALVSHSALNAVKLDGSFIDIGVPEDYWRFCALHGAPVSTC